ncbi:MAG: HAD family hydrolase [Candidatus Micrarchaeia archaeon]
MQDIKNPKLLEKYSFFIFDWDGTLTSIRLLLKIKDTISRIKLLRKGFKSSRKTSARKLGTLPTNAGIAMEEEKNGLLSLLVDFFLILSRPRLHKYTLETLALLKERGKTLVILTNAGKHRINREASYTRVSKYFSFIASARQMKEMKPSPYGILIILKHAKATKRKTLMIGDSIDDIIAAKLAGVDQCAIADGFDSYTTLKKENPTYIFKSMEEFYNKLKESKA